MISSFLRMLDTQKNAELSEEEIAQAIEAVEAKIEKARTYKKVALQFHDEYLFDSSSEEERMLERLLAEYRLLRGKHKEESKGDCQDGE